MNYKIDYDAEYWDVIGEGKRITCYSEMVARWLCDLLNEVPEAEVFKDAMIERNDRCNELQSLSEYWKQRCLAGELVISLSRKDYCHEQDVAWKNWQQLKNKPITDTEPICDHDNVIVETAADFYCPKCQRMVSWLEYHSE